MKKEHLIAVIAVCAVVIAGIMIADSYKKHKEEAEQRKAEARFLQMLEDANKRSAERIRKIREANP